MWQGKINSAEAIIRTELKDGEKLLWTGQPLSGIRFQTSDLLLIPFSLMWGGFAIFWEIMAIGMSSGLMGGPGPAEPLAFRIIFPLWGIPFVFVGLYMIFGRFIVDAQIREGTYYGVTDKRAIIIKTRFGHKVESHNLRQMPELSLTLKADGSGSVVFGARSPFAYGGSSWPGSGRFQAPGFEMIEHARSVYDIIQDAQHRTQE